MTAQSKEKQHITHAYWTAAQDAELHDNIHTAVTEYTAATFRFKYIKIAGRTVEQCKGRIKTQQFQCRLHSILGTINTLD